MTTASVVCLPAWKQTYGDAIADLVFFLPLRHWRAAFQQLYCTVPRQPISRAFLFRSLLLYRYMNVPQRTEISLRLLRSFCVLLFFVSFFFSLSLPSSVVTRCPYRIAADSLHVRVFLARLLHSQTQRMRRRGLQTREFAEERPAFAVFRHLRTLGTRVLQSVVLTPFFCYHTGISSPPRFVSFCLLAVIA